MCLSETEPPQVAPLALQVIEAVWLEYVVRLQKTVEGVARTKAKQTAQFVLTKLVFFERERFQRTTRKIAARSDETLGDVTGNLDDQVHVFSSLHIDMNAMKNQTTDSRPGGRIPCPHG